MNQVLMIILMNKKKPMRKLPVLYISLLFSFTANAQLGVLDLETKSVKYSDPSQIGQKKPEMINYSDIDGSPFWNDKWNPAFLYINGGGIVKMKKVKLNQYTNELHYIDSKGVELVTNGDNVKKLVFVKAEDTNHILSTFEAFPDYISNKGMAYYRVMNDGKFRLLILQKSVLNTAPYDALLGKAASNFFAKTYYALSDNGDFSSLKTIDKNLIIDKIHPDTAVEDWLKQNKNKLKTENEVISFFEFVNYYNSRAK